MIYSFKWPAKCTGKGCNRRPREAVVEVVGDDDIDPPVRLRALCKSCKKAFLREIQRAMATEAKKEAGL